LGETHWGGQKSFGERHQHCVKGERKKKQIINKEIIKTQGPRIRKSKKAMPRFAGLKRTIEKRTALYCNAWRWGGGLKSSKKGQALRELLIAGQKRGLPPQ